MKSPIEQQLIDGVAYWDRIGGGPADLPWMRLVDRRTLDVLGSYRALRLTQWEATIPTFTISPDGRVEFSKTVRTFDTEANARHWVETGASWKLR